MTNQNERQAVIEVKHLYAGYDGEDVLEDVNMTVYADDFVGLIGPNGGGKTTLMRVLLGLIEPSKGTVSILGRSVQEGRRMIGYVPQTVQFDRDFPISVWDVARMGRLGSRGLLSRFTAEDNEIVAESLRQVEVDDLRDRPIGALSGGQRQRVYIARALATQPRILLLDEPTSNVDPQASSDIYELLAKLNDHVTIILISHDMNAVSAYVKSVGCVNHHLFYHGDQELTPEMLELAYQCPIDLIAHGVPHRVFSAHAHETLPEKEQ